MHSSRILEPVKKKKKKKKRDRVEIRFTMATRADEEKNGEKSFQIVQLAISLFLHFLLFFPRKERKYTMFVTRALFVVVSSSQVKSSQAHSSQTKPKLSSVKSSQAKPSQAKPSLVKSSQAKPSQEKQSQVKPSQVKPIFSSSSSSSSECGKSFSLPNGCEGDIIKIQTLDGQRSPPWL